MLEKIILGNKSKLRKSRLHDEKGNLVSWKNLFFHAPLSTFTGILRLSGQRPVLPWISYTAIGFLKDFLTKESRVLEFGSGMSTIWYAQHAGEVYSVEDYLPWYEKVSAIIEQKKLINVHYQYASNEEDYCSFMLNKNIGFDLIMVDGSFRSQCISNAINLLKPGGILYLDNSDKDSSPQGGDMRLAEQKALAFAKNINAEITYFTDFAPTEFFVNQGMMIKLPKHTNNI